MQSAFLTEPAAPKVRLRDRETGQEGFSGLSMQSAVLAEPAAPKVRLRDKEKRQEGRLF
jgi:hypothetical protein